MKKTTIAIFIFFFIATTPLHQAKAEAGVVSKDGNYLYKVCNSTDEAVNQLICATMIFTTIETYLITKSLYRLHDIYVTENNRNLPLYDFCFREKTTRGQIIDSITEELRKRPELRDVDAPLFILAALHQRFPCFAPQK